MSSHREAPEISKDPVADNTDTYAFVSPDNPDTVTIITNYLPAEVPAGGPNFFEFGNDVLYTIHIDNDGDGSADIAYQFKFESKIENPNTFLYNTGPIGSLTTRTGTNASSTRVTRVDRTGPRRHVLGEGLACPPSQHRPALDAQLRNARRRSHPLARRRPDGVRWAAQRPVLRRHRVDLRPRRPAPVREPAHLPDAGNAGHRHAGDAQRPLDRDPGPDHQPDRAWLDADERDEPEGGAGRLGLGEPAQGAHGRRGRRTLESGPWVQVSRLANPLFNEVLIPMARKDEWNGTSPSEEAQFKQFVQHPELAELLPVPLPRTCSRTSKPSRARANDLVAILLTGHSVGRRSRASRTPAKGRGRRHDAAQRRGPAAQGTQSARDPRRRSRGLPERPARHRRRWTTISLRAVAGATLPLVEHELQPDDAAAPARTGPRAAADPRTGHVPVCRHAALRLRRAVGNELGAAIEDAHP